MQVEVLGDRLFMRMNAVDAAALSWEMMKLATAGWGEELRQRELFVDAECLLLKDGEFRGVSRRTGEVILGDRFGGVHDMNGGLC